MRIVKLTAENVKKLRAVEITPTGELVEITGKNGAGKTSVLDSIWWALAGTKHIQAAPIRKGETKARIRLDLGELVVERRFTEKGSSVTVEKSDGARYTSPQSILDALLGALSFDPLAFVSEEPRDQFDTLRAIAELDVDVDNLDALNRGDFDRRTDISRSVRQLRAQADGIAVPADLPAEPIDTKAIVGRMAEASEVSVAIERHRATLTELGNRAARLNSSAIEKRDRMQELRRQAEVLGQEVEAIAEEIRRHARETVDLPPPPAPVDIEGIRRDLEAAQKTNRLIEQRERQAQFAGEAADLERQARELSETMDARMKAKADAIARAKMPVEGLGLGDGIVTFNGVPFDQASTAEQLRVSVAIAMAANPKLRVIRIKEGSLLDQDNLALIAAMAHTHDYQVWIERVDTSGKVGIVIDDGAVVAVNGEPA